MTIKAICGTFVANNWAIIKHKSSFGLTRCDLKVNSHLKWRKTQLYTDVTVSRTVKTKPSLSVHRNTNTNPYKTPITHCLVANFEIFILRINFPFPATGRRVTAAARSELSNWGALCNHVGLSSLIFTTTLHI